mmetsp:Transcript_22981/g.60766  ORF Transcript_22981/g.60766 Transcript_22981/m.60766 type:complete len:232 (-) Transcript_22981:1797-2492(-)
MWPVRMSASLFRFCRSRRLRIHEQRRRVDTGSKKKMCAHFRTAHPTYLRTHPSTCLLTRSPTRSSTCPTKVMSSGRSVTIGSGPTATAPSLDSSGWIARAPTPTPTSTSIPRRQPRSLALSAPPAQVITFLIPSLPVAPSPRGNGGRRGQACRNTFTTGLPVPSAEKKTGLGRWTKRRKGHYRRVTGALATTVSQTSRVNQTLSSTFTANSTPLGTTSCPGRAGSEAGAPK